MTQDEHPHPTLSELKALVRTIPDHPQPGILFRDITTLIQDSRGFVGTVEALAQRIPTHPVDRIVGVESRGFLFAAPLAFRLNKGVVLIRKAGKLPAQTTSEKYTLEYGEDRLEIHLDALKPGMSVFMVDDLLATGGTMTAACRLVERMGARVAGCIFVIELVDLGGRERLHEYPLISLITFEGA